MWKQSHSRNLFRDKDFKLCVSVPVYCNSLFLYRLGFSISGTTDILGEVCCVVGEGCPVQWKIFSSIPGLYLLDASIILFPSFNNQNVFGYWNALWGAKLLHLRTIPRAGALERDHMWSQLLALQLLAM